MIKLCATFLSTIFMLAATACFVNDSEPNSRNGGKQKNIKDSINWNSPFNLVRLDLAKNKLPPLDRRTVVELQKEMWQKGVPINPAYFLPLPTDSTNDLDEQEW